MIRTKTPFYHLLGRRIKSEDGREGETEAVIRIKAEVNGPGAHTCKEKKEGRKENSVPGRNASKDGTTGIMMSRQPSKMARTLALYARLLCVEPARGFGSGIREWRAVIEEGSLK